jgi:hypothetical protein
MNLKILQNLSIFCKLSAAKQRRLVFIPVLLYLYCFRLPDAQAAFDKLEMGAEPLAMGNAIVALRDSPYSIYYNPAAIGCPGAIGIALSYQSFYALKGISQTDLILNFFAAGQPFALAINRFGNNHYTEIRMAMGGSYNLGNQCSIGTGFQLYYLRISEYGQQLTWGVDLGLLVDLLPALTLGAIVTNVNQPRLAKTAEKLPQIMTLGCNFEPVEDMRLLFAVYKDLHFNEDYRVGFSFQIRQGFIFRCGLEDDAEIIGVGFGVTIKQITFDYTLRSHQILGLSHALSFILII